MKVFDFQYKQLIKHNVIFILKREVCSDFFKKNGQATYIAPLQPFTLATFRSWGSSTGAGRIRLARSHKSNILLNLFK